MSADELRGLATKIHNVWKSDPAHCDLALALHKWAPGTLRSWARHLQLLATSVVQYPGLPKDKVLATYLKHLAVEGKNWATLRGAISAVCLCEKLGFLAPTTATLGHGYRSA